MIQANPACPEFPIFTTRPSGSKREGNTTVGNSCRTLTIMRQYVSQRLKNSSPFKHDDRPQAGYFVSPSHRDK